MVDEAGIVTLVAETWTAAPPICTDPAETSRFIEGEACAVTTTPVSTPVPLAPATMASISDWKMRAWLMFPTASWFGIVRDCARADAACAAEPAVEVTGDGHAARCFHPHTGALTGASAGAAT